MSRTIDSKVVEMSFDNKRFEENVSTSMSTLEKLKQSLNFNGATKGFENVNAAAKSVNFSSLGGAVESVGLKFNAMWTIADQTLRNITNSVESTAKRMISALTIDPIKTGFSEYETKINSIQTIMSNTASKGTTMEDVTKVIGELNTYADKTIYNFAEMTRNIGTFTAAGVGLEESATAIQGIANLAAVSGSTSQQASTAMYQLSQAMASGTVKLMDWNSVVNAGMGGQVFQDALKDTARAHGVAVDDIIKKQGSFRESLSEGWLTADILTETLSKMTKSGAAEYLSNLTGVELDQITAAQKLVDENKDGTASYEELAETLSSTGKISKDEALNILKMADNAEDAATKVKTFTQLWDTLKESAQSGWSQTWELLIGDFEEAKEFLTSLSDLFGGIINDSAERRNKLLGSALGDRTLGMSWVELTHLQALAEDTGKSIDELLKDRGVSTGREMLLESLMNVIEGIGTLVKPVKEALSEIFPAITAQRLYDIIEGFRDLTEKFKLSDSASEKLKATFKGLFAIVSIVGKVLGAVGLAVWNLITSDGFVSLVNLCLDATAAIGDFFTSINDGLNTGGLSGALGVIVDWISNLLSSTTEGIESFGDVFAAIGRWIGDTATAIWNFVKPVFTWIRENVSIGDVFAGLAGGGIFMVARKLSGVFDTIKDAFENLFGGGGDGLAEIKEKISDVLGSLSDSLQAFTVGIKVWSLVGIAVAITLLASAMQKISELSVPDIAKSLIAISALIGLLSLGFSSMTKSLSKFKPKGMIKAGISLALLAVAVGILADAMVTLSDLSLGEIAKGLVGVGGGIALLCGGLKLLNGTKVSLSTSIAMLALAYSCSILGDALKKFSAMTWDEIGRGLTAMGGAIGELVIALSVLGKFGGMGSLLGSVGILIAVQSLEKMAEGLKSFAEMSWEEIERGLAAMGGALGELAIALGGLGKIAGFSSIFAAGALLIVIQGLDDLAAALKMFGEMSWDEIGRGLTAMGGALLEVGVVLGLLGGLVGFSSLFAAGSILLVIQGLDDLANALQKFGFMAWDEIGRGLTAMGGALLEVAGITGALGMLAGISGIFGAGAILITIQGLDDLANALQRFGSMAWDEIGRGLVAMGGALLEVAAISGATGALTGFAGLVGAGTILLVVQGLDDLASALQQFGSMSWDEIGRGLTAMGGALAELALGGLLNTLSILGAFSISTVAEPLGVLADSVKKWNGVTVPDGLGGQLSSLAAGVFSFTLDGLGASAIAELAAPLGTLADSVTKWQGVTVPEGIGTQLDALSDGIGSFTFKGLAASAIADLGAPLGDLADSVSKWSTVTIPEDLGDQLSALADGVSGFTWLFMAGWSLDTIIEPLGELADSVTKWNDVDVPSKLGDDLTDLADAVKSFSWAFLGGWSIDAIVGPLGDLADSVKKWNDVSVPDSIGDDLKSISSGVESFVGIGSISDATDGMESIATEAAKLDDIDYATIGTGMVILVSALNNLSNVDTSNVSSLNTLSEAIKSAADSVKSASSQFTSAGSNLMDSLGRGIQSRQGAVTSAITVIMTVISRELSSKAVQFYRTGIILMTQLIMGISRQSGALRITVVTSVSNAATAINTQYSSFYTNGQNLGSGLVLGINSKWWSVYYAAYSLGQAAVQGEKDGQASNSPSKLTIQAGKWFGQGLVIGIDKMSSKVYSAAHGLGETAVNSISSTISNIADAINTDLDTQPTIRPVLDLSNVRSGVSNVGRILGGMGASVGVMANVSAISSMMNDRIQNGGNSEVVSAINKLRKDLGNIGGTTNYINGVTYDDGSNITEAVAAIVHAAKVERRA